MENKESFYELTVKPVDYNAATLIWYLKDRIGLLFLKAHEINAEADSRLLKLSLFSMVLVKSPLTSIYFTTFEKKRKVRSPLLGQSNFLVFGIYFTFFENMSTYALELSCILLSISLKKIVKRGL